MMKLLFRKTIKLNDEEPSSNTNASIWKQRCRKWDRSIASMFGLLAFCTFVGIVIYNIFGSKCSHCDDDCEGDVKTNYKLRTGSKCTIVACTVTCNNIIEGNHTVEYYVSAVIYELCSELELVLKNTDFKNGELSTGWLAEINRHVTKLEIRISNLREIKAEAFVGQPFKSLKILLIEEAKLVALRKHSFQGLDGLNTFEIRNNAKQSLHIEENALDGMKASLAVLQVLGFILNSNSILNLVGTKAPNLPDLKLLDLSSNTVSALLPDSFVKAQKLESLFLSSSQLEMVDKNAFRLCTNIRLLHLNNNLLTTLSNGTFSNMALRDQQLYLGGNPWNCTCPLQWLKDYYVEQKIINEAKPPECDGSPIDDHEFCPVSSTLTFPTTPTSTTISTSPTSTTFPTISTSTTTTSPPTISTFPTATSPTISISSTTTTSPTSSTPTTSLSTPSSSNCPTILAELGMVKIFCNSPLGALENVGVDTSHRAAIVVQDQNVILSFQELESDILYVRVIITEAPVNLSTYFLVWFNSEDKSEHGCIDSIRNNMILENLNRGTTYTFSVLEDCQSETSPKCTFGINTLPEWSLRAWILNERQGLVIGLTVLVVVCIVCFAICITFLCIRRNPKLISSNKSVIIVKPKKTSEGVAPRREYEKPTYWEPYLVPSSQGYLTPKYHRYARVRYRPPLMRSISEWSVSSSPSVYVTSQSAHQNHRNEVMEVYDHNDFRPPLPPPNPGPSKPHGRIADEVLYSSV